MPKVTYTKEQKAEAVALAVIVGADAAAAQLGYPDARAIRRWVAAAGKAPADAIGSADWAALGELARAQVAAALAAGKVRPKDAAVIGAIAARNVQRDDKPEPEAPRSEADVEWDWLEAELEKHSLSVDWALDLLIGRLTPCTELDDATNCGHDHTPEGELAWLLSLGDLQEYAERKRIEDHEAMERQLELNRQIAEASKQLVMDEETAALVAAAEAFLQETAP